MDDYHSLSAPEKKINYFLNLLKMYFNSICICLSERRETEASFLSTPYTLFFKVHNKVDFIRFF